MFSNTFLPQSNALLIDPKLLSIIMISAAYFATSVPSDIQKPTSAFMRAGASPVN